MPRLTVTIGEEHERILEQKSDIGQSYRSKSEVVRECIEAHDRVEGLARQVSTLETEVESLREQRRELEQKAARVEQLEEKLWNLQMEYQELLQRNELDDSTEPTLSNAVEMRASDTSNVSDTPKASDAGALDTDAVESGHPGRNNVEPGSVESGSVESANVESSSVESGSVKSGSVESGSVESGSVKSGSVESGSVESGSVETNTANTGTAGTDTVESGTVVIDEELVYSSGGVGTRLKSAIFGGGR